LRRRYRFRATQEKPALPAKAREEDASSKAREHPKARLGAHRKKLREIRRAARKGPWQ
jgi:hypothetical protein